MAGVPPHPAAPQSSHRPADAYGIVVPHLPPGYLTTPPPPKGVIMHVIATSDGVATQWAMGRDDALALAHVLSNTPGARYHTSSYADRS